VLEIDFLARTYGAEILRQPRHILKGLRLLRDYRQARGAGGD
jgi:hypothetical protein